MQFAVGVLVRATKAYQVPSLRSHQVEQPAADVPSRAGGLGKFVDSNADTSSDQYTTDADNPRIIFGSLRGRGLLLGVGIDARRRWRNRHHLAWLHVGATAIGIKNRR